ncbi:MAG: alpha/beta hydrolase [Deltaproteobacteria bacterium]|nr:alpha/beta hydrolase [Deltaproteobacteria bacterium]
MMTLPLRTYRYSKSRRIRRPARIDVWQPEGSGKHPSALLVHGGGFLGGNRSMRAVKTVATHLTANGFAVAAFDYRLIMRGGRFDEAMDDAVEAMAWWRRHLDELGLDRARVSVIGLSAGAAIAAGVASRLGRLHRLVGVYGPYDFLRLPKHHLVARVLLRTREHQEWQRRSPARSCEIEAPVGLFHGLDDRLVPPEHSHELARFRRERGLPVKVQLYQDARHGFLRHPELAVTQKALTDVHRFLVEKQLS